MIITPRTPSAVATPRSDAARIERTIRHWQGIIAGDGLTRADLLFAALQLRKALRARVAMEGEGR